jgi:hypothetical protein
MTIIAFLLQKYRLFRAAFKTISRSVRHRRDERVFERGSARTLWRDWPSDVLFVFHEIGNLPRRRRQLYHYFLQLGAEHDAAEPFLRVARLAPPQAFEWDGPTVISFPNRQVPGDFEVKWDQGKVQCKLAYDGAPMSPGTTVLTLTSPPAGKIVGTDLYGTAKAADEAVLVEGIVDTFTTLFPVRMETSFSARSVTRRISEAPTAYTRYTYLGVRLSQWRLATQRFERHPNGDMSAPVARDSDEATLFGRRARLTQASEGQGSGDVISVTLAGPPLEDPQETVLRHVVSFVAGARAQALAIERFDDTGSLTGGKYLNEGEYGQTKSPPFDMSPAGRTLDPATWSILCDGFAKMVAQGYPLWGALHHLHDSNSGWYEVEIKNLLFCIHTLFEKWSDIFDQRVIVTPRSTYKRAERQARGCLRSVFSFSEEAAASTITAIRFGNHRSGSELQALFFDSLGVVLTDCERNGLQLRNELFHNGYIKHDVQSQSELQKVLDMAGALRTLAHLAILKLAEYNGLVFDWQTFVNRICLSGYP